MVIAGILCLSTSNLLRALGSGVQDPNIFYAI